MCSEIALHIHQHSHALKNLLLNPRKSEEPKGEWTKAGKPQQNSFTEDVGLSNMIILFILFSYTRYSQGYPMIVLC